MNPSAQKHPIRLGLGAGLLLLASSAQAGLIAYESGGVNLVYDDMQDLTWTRDASLFKTQYDADNTVVEDLAPAHLRRMAFE